MNKIIFLVSGFAFNSAPFNRFVTIAKAVGFTNPYEIIDIRPSGTKFIEGINHIDAKKINYDDIIIERTLSSTHKSNNLFVKLLRPTKERIYAVKLLRNKIIRNDTVLYLNSVSLVDIILYYLIAKIYKTKYVTERSEYPLLIRSPKKFKTFYYRNFILPWCFKLFDGMIIMTDPLIQFYSQFKRKNCKLLKIPMTVDVERFNKHSNKIEKYIGYVGSLSNKKDGLDILIKAYSQVAIDFPEYSLRIAGSSSNPKESENLIKLTSELDVESMVHFSGEVSRDKIPAFLKRASLLVLARPESKQAEGGFPTKLGEYLATGKPVIVTKVGEIGHFLKHRINAFMVDPGSVEDLADKMKQVLRNYGEAKLIGENGRKTALENFDYRVHAKRLKEFFETI